MKIFHVGSRQFRDLLRELLRELRVSYCSSREMPFREWNFSFRESLSEFRELLREYPETLPELREWPFHSSVFPEIGGGPQASENCALLKAPLILPSQPRSKIHSLAWRLAKHMNENQGRRSTPRKPQVWLCFMSKAPNLFVPRKFA